MKYLITGLLIVLVGCSTSKERSHISVFHVSTLNQFAKPTTDYISSNANIILHFTSQDIDKAIAKIQSLKSNFKKYEGFESGTFFRRNSDELEFRLGASEDCDYVILNTDNRGICNKGIYKELIDIFKVFSF